jgi:hypothetical protein
VDAQPRLQFLGRDVMLPNVMASDPAHDPNLNALPVEALFKDSEASCSQHLQPSIQVPSHMWTHTNLKAVRARAIRRQSS